MHAILRKFFQKFGYDLVKHKGKDYDSQLRIFLEANDITAVIDVGANIGQYATRLFAIGWQKEIISFEANPEVQTQLASRAAAFNKKNSKKFPLFSKKGIWQVLDPMAVGSHTGQVEFQISAESDMSSVLPQSDVLKEISSSSEISKKIQVPMRRLDEIKELTSRKDRLFLKMDVQGFEAEVLAGASGLLPQIIGIQMELSLLTLYKGETLWLDMIEKMRGLGYETRLLFPGYFERKLARLLQVDCVFLKIDSKEDSEN